MSNCINCDKKFGTTSGKRLVRKSIESKLEAVDRTVKSVIEEEFGVTLTPAQKEKRFLCSSCAWTLASVAKSTESKSKAKKKLLDTSSSSGYLKEKLHNVSFIAKKIRSPAATPRKIKRPRLFSPEKSTQMSSTAKVTEMPGVPEPAKSLKIKIKAADQELERGIRNIRWRQYRKGVNILMNSKPGFKKAVSECVQEVIRKEIVSQTKQENTAFKGKQTLEEMSVFDWDTVFTELTHNCPTLTNILISLVTSKTSSKFLGLSSSQTTSVKPIVGTIAALVFYMRKPRTLCSLQEMNSLQMWLSSTKREMFSRFNHLGLCVGQKATRSVIDRIRSNYNNEVLKWKNNVSEILIEMSDETTADTIPYGDSESDPREMTTDIESDMDLDIIPPIVTESVSTTDQPSETESSSLETEPEGKLAYSLCFDNVNTKVTVRHQTKDKRNKMFNMVQAYAAKDRIPTLHLADNEPSPETLSNIPLDVYFPTELDEVTLRSEMTVIVLRILCTTLEAFKDLRAHINQHIIHKYSKASSRKSEMIPLGVMDKDESKIADIIDIMEQYQKYVPFKPNGDPLTIPLYADGLSCERGHDAQSARINGNDPWNQLQGFILNAQEWHKRCTVLQDYYDELFGSSGRDKGTMYQLKNYFNHRNVTLNVKQSFNYNEEFLDFCGDGYLTLAAMHFMGIRELNETPDGFPTVLKERLSYLENVASQIMDLVFLSSIPVVKRILDQGEQEERDDLYDYCICRQDVGGPMVFCDNRNCNRGVWFHLECMNMSEDDIPDGKWFCSESCKKEAAKRKTKKRRRRTVADTLSDGKMNYVVMLIWRSLNQKVRRDAIRENDGKRMIMHWKFDMLQFFENHHPKYFLLGQRFLTAVSGVSPRIQHTLTWNRTVNPNGGKGKNIEMDLQMEFYNKDFKESVKDAAGQLTEKTIARHSQMIGVGKQLRQIYDKKVSETTRRTVHKRQDVSRDPDFAEFVSLLIKEDFFTPHPGRAFTSFPDIDLELYSTLDTNQVRVRLEKHKKLMVKRRRIIIQMQRR